MIRQKTLEYFFENVQDGDKIGFYRTGIFSSLINFFQKTDKSQNLDDVCHVANVFDVIRLSNGKNKEILSFMISHQTGATGGSYDSWVIEREKDLNIGVYKYYIKTKTKYTKSNRGQRYGYLSIIAYMPFVSNFLAKYFNVKIFHNMKPVCTTHIVRCDEFAGRNVKEFELKYPFPTPEILLTYNKEDFKGNLYEITDFKNAKI
jgi:hypothetical protein